MELVKPIHFIVGICIHFHHLFFSRNDKATCEEEEGSHCGCQYADVATLIFYWNLHTGIIYVYQYFYTSGRHV